MARKRIKPNQTTQRERTIAKLVLSQSILDNVIELQGAKDYLPTLEFLKTEVDKAIVHFRLLPDIYGRPPAHISRNVQRTLDHVYDLAGEVTFKDIEDSGECHIPELYLIIVFEVMMVDLVESMKNPANVEMVQYLADSAIIMSKALSRKAKTDATYNEALKFVNKIYTKMGETWI